MQNSCLACVTREDTCRCFAGETLPAIRPQSGTSLEVPVPEDLNGQNYQIDLKSVEVLLVNKEAWSSLPVAVPVPPPEDLLLSTPALCTSPLLLKPALAQTQEPSRPSSPQLPVPDPCLCLYQSSGRGDPTAELTVSSGPAAKNKDPGKLSSVPSCWAAQRRTLDPCSL